MRRDKPPAQRHSDCYSRKIYTASASGKSDCNPDKPETLGSSDSLTALNPCAGGRRKTDGSQKPIHNVKERTHEIYPAGKIEASKKDPNGCIPFNRFSGRRSPKPHLFLSTFAISLRQKASADTPAPKGLRVACHPKPKT